MTTKSDRIHILIVDDKEANLMALETILRNPDWSLIKARSGNEALGYLLDYDFACILLDVKMPDMDGFELARVIRGDDRTKYLPMLFVSGHSKGENDVALGYELGAVDYLMKPLDAAIVKSKVNVFVELHKRGRLLKEANEQLRKTHELLETRVQERTAELSAANDALLRSNRELEQFSYISAHDLQEPLRMVRIHIQLLEEHINDRLDPTGFEYMKVISDGAKRMQDLISDLLLYSRTGKQHESFVMVDGNRVLDGALGNLAAMIEETGATVVRSPLPSVTGSENQLIQLFQNLIGNALKFRGSARPEIEIRYTENEREFHFEVKDNGIGIDPNYKERIFEIFQRLHSRTKYPGTGIGLTICRKVVELHGGRIWVVSQEQKGSVFHFTLLKQVPEVRA